MGHTIDGRAAGTSWTCSPSTNFASGWFVSAWSTLILKRAKASSWMSRASQSRRIGVVFLYFTLSAIFFSFVRFVSTTCPRILMETHSWKTIQQTTPVRPTTRLWSYVERKLRISRTIQDTGQAILERIVMEAISNTRKSIHGRLSIICFLLDGDPSMFFSVLPGTGT